MAQGSTGFGKLQLTTIIARNPYLSKSAQLVRPFGLGNVDDGKSGTVRLLGQNRAKINNLIWAHRDNRTTNVAGVGKLKLKVLLSNDTSSVRHCEHLANSGFCSCSRESALRVTPAKPKDIQEMKETLRCGPCQFPTYFQRVNWSHTPRKGQRLPDPCTRPGCTFGHNPDTLEQEYNDLLAEEARLEKDDSRAGKTRYSEWRMKHARAHGNVQPGLHGAPTCTSMTWLIKFWIPCTLRCSTCQKSHGSTEF